MQLQAVSDDDFENNNNELEIQSNEPTAPEVGTKVRALSTSTVTKGAVGSFVGVVTYAGRMMWHVNFPAHSSWMGAPDDLEIVSSIDLDSEDDNTTVCFHCFRVPVIGKAYIVFNGKCMLGPDYPKCSMSATLIIVLSGLFLSTATATEAVFVFLFSTISLIFLGITGSMDPGVVLRGQGAAVGTWCSRCSHTKPFRAGHCAYCDNCVERFDHHCPWIGTCIGGRNYPFFFGFITTVSGVSLAVTVLSVLKIRSYMNTVIEVAHSPSSFNTTVAETPLSDDSLSNVSELLNMTTTHPSLSKALLSNPISVGLIATSFIIFLLVFGLLCFHCYLLAFNITTYEFIKQSYSEKENPHNVGCLRNWYSVLFGQRMPSKVTSSLFRFGKYAGIDVEMSNYNSDEEDFSGNNIAYSQGSNGSSEQSLPESDSEAGHA